MSRNRVITAIDVGTDKCVTLVATIDEVGALNVVGVHAVPSRGMRKSAIVDLEQVVGAVSESLDGAERMAGFDVKSAYLSLGGVHISSINSKGVVAVASPDHEITSLDVERVIEAARAVSLPNDRDVIHVIPRNFKVDSQDGIKDPVGMTGFRLESEAHIITGMTTSLRNLEKCITDLGLEVDGFVFSGLASSEVVLTETEKELGVMVVDIGAGSTSLSVFVEGVLEFSASIPVGARHITQDIALGCRLSLGDADKIKLHLSSGGYESIKPLPGESKEDLNKRRKKADQLDLQKIGVFDSADVLSKKTLVEGIMMPRMKEIFVLIGQKLEEQSLLESIPAGLVISGGGAETVGIAEVARHTLNLPARVGRPDNIKGMVTDISGPSFATSVGLLHYGASQGKGQPMSSGFSPASLLSKIPVKAFGDKIGALFKSILP